MRSRQHFPCLLAGHFLPQKNLMSMCIQSRRSNSCLCGQHLQPRDGHHRNPCGFSQAFHGGQPHAHAGKAARPVHGHNRAELAELHPCPGQKLAYGRHQSRRVAAPFQFNLAENLDR